MKIIKTGLAAFGLSGRIFHAPFLHLHEGFELSAVVERTKNVAQTLYPGIKTVRSFEALLDEAIDLVIINTPDPTHYDFCRMALEAGKHVVVEKPFVFSSEQARELIALAQRRQRLLTVYQNRRFDGDFLTVQDIVRNGYLGRVVEFQSAFQRYRPQLSPIAWKEQSQGHVGITYNLCSHLSDQALVLFGKPDGVWARMDRQRASSQIDDYCDMRLIYPHLQVSLRAGMLIREPGPRFAVHGTAGSYVKYGLDPQEGILRAGGHPSRTVWSQESEAEWGILHTDAGRNPYPTVPGNYLSYYDDLYQALCEGRTPYVTPEEMITDVRMLEAAFESAQSGRIVPL